MALGFVLEARRSRTEGASIAEDDLSSEDEGGGIELACSLLEVESGKGDCGGVLNVSVTGEKSLRWFASDRSVCTTSVAGAITVVLR